VDVDERCGGGFGEGVFVRSVSGEGVSREGWGVGWWLCGGVGWGVS